MSSTDFTVVCHCRFPAYCLSVRLAVCWPMACHCLTECPQSQSSVTGWHATLTGLRASAHAMTMNGQLACCGAELWLVATAAAAWQCVYSDSHCGEWLTRNSYWLVPGSAFCNDKQWAMDTGNWTNHWVSLQAKYGSCCDCASKLQDTSCWPSIITVDGTHCYALAMISDYFWKETASLTEHWLPW